MRTFRFLSIALIAAIASACSAEGGGLDGPSNDTGVAEVATVDAAAPPDTTTVDAGAEIAVPDVGADTAPPIDTAPKSLDLHDVTLFDNPADLADWPETTKLTAVELRTDGVHLEFSKRDGAGSWPDITPPGWDGPLQYTVGLVEYIDGKWYGSAAIQYWRGLDASGGNLAEDVDAKTQCTAFGYGSSCQIARNWYYDGRWGKLSTYQPKTGELIGIFVIAGNVRGVKDGTQSPVHERSNIVLVPMPALAGAKHTF